MYLSAAVLPRYLPSMTREELFAANPVRVSGLVPAHGFDQALSTHSLSLEKKIKALGSAYYAGKVRDRLDLGDRVLMYTSDRVSAFDRILALVPFKGEVLNRISTFWFEATRDIVPNHVLRTVGGRGLLAKKANVIPVEVVVRGHLTGSAWRDYEAGHTVSGIALAKGMRRDQRFDNPIITPSTKEAIGSHDMPISAGDIVAKGIVPEKIWRAVEQAALALFRRGSEIAAKQGLLLVDTKYEFGLLPGSQGPEGLILVDEIHTPDSSRFWYADGFQERFETGKDQRKLDKEYLRAWLMEHGFSGNGTAPEIPDDVLKELAWRYVSAFQEITGQNFKAISQNPEAEASLVESVLSTGA